MLTKILIPDLGRKYGAKTSSKSQTSTTVLMNAKNILNIGIYNGNEYLCYIMK